jgi:hypothetical protein
MHRHFMLVTMALALFPAAASAQYYQRPQLNPLGRPALSPYLDVVRGGNPAINYYLGTLPEFERRALAAQQQALLGQLQQPQPAPSLDQEDILPALPPTGHAAGFQVFGGYYTFQTPPRNFLPLPTTRKR